MNFWQRNKRKIVWLIGMIFLCSYTIGQQNDNIVWEEEIVCGDMNFILEGSIYLKPNQQTTYSIVTSSLLDQQARVEYELWQQDTLLQVWSEHQFTYTFDTTGTYVLKTILRRSELCQEAKEQTITVAEQIWLGIWLPEKDTTFLTNSVTAEWIIFLFLPGLKDPLQDDAYIRRIQSIAHILPISDVLFVEETQIRLLFNHLDDIRKFGIGFPERIILIGNISTSALRRFLHQAPMITEFSEIAIIPAAYISSLVQHILNETPLQQLDVVRLMNTQYMTSKRRLPLSKTVDQLLNEGMSIEIILLLLLLPISALVLIILKQIFWLTLWGVYYLLLSAWAILLVGYKIVIVMFLAALVSQIITHLITKYIYLLYAPKVALTLTLTCLLFLWSNIVITWLFGIAWPLPTNTMHIFFPLITFSLMMQYIYPHLSSGIQRVWRGWFIQFVGWVYILVQFIQRHWLQQFVLWYPDSVLLVVIAIIGIWRYAWLQVSEYVRFWPLIAKQLKDEA